MTSKSTSAPDLRKKFLIGTFSIGLGGVILSTYSLKNHLAVKTAGASNALCNINQTFSCDTVAKSSYSEIFGTPVALWGIGFFAALIILSGLALFTEKSRKENEAGIYGLAYIGTISSVILGLIAWFGVGAVCISCVGVYLLNFALLGLCLKLRSQLNPSLTTKTLFNGLSTAALVVALTIFGFRMAQPSEGNPPTADISAGDQSLTLGSTVQDLGITRSAYAGLGEDFRKGGDQAKITVVEFSDFECPACARAAPVIRELNATFGQQVLFVFKNFPLDKSCNKGMQQELHKFACTTAKLARCAGQLGKFWDFHDKAYAEQANLNNETAKNWAKSLGLSDLQIDQCLSSKDILAKIEEDISIGEKAGVNGTPAIFINGRKYNGNPSYSELKSVIERELR